MKYYIGNSNIEGFKRQTIEDLKSWLETLYNGGLRFLYLDTETKRMGNSSVKFDIHDNELVSIQIGTKWDQWFIDATSVSDLSFLDHFIIVGHNIKFDYQILKLEKDYELKKVYDTMIGEYLLTTGLTKEKGYYSLEETHLRYYGSNPYGNQLSLFDPWIPKSTRSNIEEITRELVFYGCTDIEVTAKIHEAQALCIKEEELERVQELENQFVLVLGDMELNGVPLDIDRWLELDEWTQEKKITHESVLRSSYPEVENWNSPKQVVTLFKKLGINVTTKDGKESVNELVIGTQDHPAIKQYLEYKKFSKLKSTYGLKFLKHVSPITDRIHSSFLQILNTGRIASTSPNLQNIVSGSDDFLEGHEWRKAFRPEKGRKFVIADYGSQELRVVANLANEQVMIDAFANGKDLHALAAAALYEIPLEEVTKEKRKNAKIFNFSVLYGAGVDKVADTFKVSKAKAKQLIENYYKKFSSLKKFQDETLQKTLANGYILVDSLGRKSWLPKFEEYKYTRSKKLLAEYTRINSNYQIQGTAASMLKMAAVILRERLKGTNAKIILLVHDEVVIECDDNIAEDIKIILEEAMNIAASYFCKNVPPPADAIIADCWYKK